MTLPRQILPGRFYLLTRRCTQRQFLLRPDEETNNAFVYCLGEAAARFGIDVIAAQQMSNHAHITLFDRDASVVEFMQHFHKMLAKCVNSLRGRWENLWSSAAPSLVELVDRRDVIDKIVYTAANPVLDDLVERVDHWPGAKTVRALLRQMPLTATRPRFFFSEGGTMPAEATLNFAIPSELGDPTEVVAEIRERIAAVEEDRAKQRCVTGKRIVGRRGVLRQSWRDSPTSREPRRNLSPRVAARCKWSRIEALARNQAFLDAYRVARDAWLRKEPIEFPRGTYWMVRFVGAPVA